MPIDPGMLRLLSDDPAELTTLMLGPEDERLMFLVKEMGATLSNLMGRIRMVERMVGITPMDEPMGVTGDRFDQRSDRGRD